MSQISTPGQPPATPDPNRKPAAPAAGAPAPQKTPQHPHGLRPHAAVPVTPASDAPLDLAPSPAPATPPGAVKPAVPGMPNGPRPTVPGASMPRPPGAAAPTGARPPS